MDHQAASCRQTEVYHHEIAQNRIEHQHVLDSFAQLLYLLVTLRDTRFRAKVDQANQEDTGKDR